MEPAKGKCPYCYTKVDAATAFCPNRNCGLPLSIAMWCTASPDCAAVGGRQYVDGELCCAYCNTPRPVIEHPPFALEFRKKLNALVCPECNCSLKSPGSISSVSYGAQLVYACTKCSRILPATPTIQRWVAMP